MQQYMLETNIDAKQDDIPEELSCRTEPIVEKISSKDDDRIEDVEQDFTDNIDNLLKIAYLKYKGHSEKKISLVTNIESTNDESTKPNDSKECI